MATANDGELAPAAMVVPVAAGLARAARLQIGHGGERRGGGAPRGSRVGRRRLPVAGA
jgi:hypothetical protein